MSKPHPMPHADADNSRVSQEVEAELRKRLETFDEDAKPRVRGKTSLPA
jgi:hypothetical protein